MIICSFCVDIPFRQVLKEQGLDCTVGIKKSATQTEKYDAM